MDTDEVLDEALNLLAQAAEAASFAQAQELRARAAALLDRGTAGGRPQTLIMTEQPTLSVVIKGGRQRAA